MILNYLYNLSTNVIYKINNTYKNNLKNNINKRFKMKTSNKY